MVCIRSFFALSALVATLLAGLAAGQGGRPFTIDVRQGGTLTTIPAGGTVSLAAPAIGLPATAAVTITYNGQTATNITAITVTGSTDFSINHATPPFPVEEGQTFSLSVRYTPSDSTLKEAQVEIRYTAGNSEPTLAIVLKGSAPEFGYSYTPQGGNATQVTPGQTIQFADTSLESTGTAAFTITNRGTAEGTLDTVTWTGEVYAVAGLPLLPATIAAGDALTVTLKFTPATLGLAEGALSIGRPGGPDAFALAGAGTGARYEYEIVRKDATEPVLPGQSIPFGDVRIAETSSVGVRVRNTGNAEGVLSAIAVSGEAYKLSNLPFLPATIAPGQPVLFALSFTPAEIGALPGRLRIGDAEFVLAGSGVGTFLEYALIGGGAPVDVEPGGKVIFAPAALGGFSSVGFAIRNSGTAPATIISISLAKTGGAFSVSGLPALPVVLAAGSSLEFSLKFEPQAEGNVTESLLVDSATFVLSGAAAPPPALPAFAFSGASGVQPPKTQPAVGLALAAPYDLAIAGTLTLSFASDAFANDPAIQFSTGGRTVAFEIPAGATQAVFPNGTDQVKIQTGTVAGTLSITPAFATRSGVDLTPDPVTPLTVRVIEAAPAITSALISDKRLSSLTLQISGYATNRSVGRISFSFRGRSGENLATTSLNIDASSQFAAWFLNSSSTAFGSQFAATVPLTFSGATNNVSGQTNAVESIEVTLSNSLGNSAPVTVENPL